MSILMVRGKKKSEHYVNNKEFYQALVEYNKKVDEAKSLGLPKPRITNYLGDCFLRIANHLAYKPNFVNYMFKDDMICDGIENCVQYIHNFDINRTNPFAYFTQIVYYAFLRRIAKEKKQLEIKSTIIERSGYDEVFSIDDPDFSGGYSDMNSIKDNINYRFQ
jgi:hypothetical protein